MQFAGISYLAVLIAAAISFVFGAVYYGLVSKPWMKAARIQPKEGSGMAAPGAGLLINSFVCELVMAFVLAAMIAGLTGGASTIASGLTVGFFAWLGFMATTMAVNHRYEGYGWDLTVIDGIHWLGVALIMGAVIGWWG